MMTPNLQGPSLPMKPSLLLTIVAKLFIVSAILLPMNMSEALEKTTHTDQSRVLTGADLLVDDGFSVLDGKRVGLIANQTTLANGEHLADLLHRAENVTLAAIFAPEHGFRGLAEAGAKVKDGADPETGVPVHSLYGSHKKPSQNSLRDIDVLLFDIQDIGVRYYTYISTMGLAMQAAAEAGIPFIVLDRPNPLGGTYVSGFVLEPKLRSFVGQYPIPIVHGLTVGELALMIRDRNWLPGLKDLDLTVIEMQGWNRAMRWPQTRRGWVMTSPNIPTFESALTYPGIGIIGETMLANEGRGTEIPFQKFGAPGLNTHRATNWLNTVGLPGVQFRTTDYVPRSIPRVATEPRFRGKLVNGIQPVVTDVDKYLPLETGIYALTFLVADARARGFRTPYVNRRMFHLISGTKRLHRMLMAGEPAGAIIAAWRTEVATFKKRRKPYLLYR